MDFIKGLWRDLRARPVDTLVRWQEQRFLWLLMAIAMGGLINSPTGIHYVDIGIDDAHGTCHDILRHFGIKMPASHKSSVMHGLA